MGGLFSLSDEELEAKIRKLPVFQEIMTSLEKLTNDVMRNKESFDERWMKIGMKQTKIVDDVKNIDKKILTLQQNLETNVNEGKKYNKKFEDIQRLQKSNKIMSEQLQKMDRYLAWPMYWDVENKIYDKVPSCIICEARPRNVIWFPCRHVLMCEECSHSEIIRDSFRQKKCPICIEMCTDTELITWRWIDKNWNRENRLDPTHKHFFMSSRFQICD